jgi:hypothetical protein
MKLVDGSRTLDLSPVNGFAVESYDLGFPEVRRVSNPRPQADGELDRTRHHGARAVSLDIAVWREDDRTLQTLVDSLWAFCRPGSRPWLVLDNGRMVRLAVDQLSAPISNPTLRKVRAQWRAPDGRIYAVNEKVRHVFPGLGSETGRTYDLSFDREYPFSGGAGSLRVTNEGTTVTEPVLRIFGPCEAPQVINETVGARLSFPGLSIAGGEYVEVDVAERTVRSNGLAAPEFNRYRDLDFVASSWWGVEPGRNVLRFVADVWEPPAQVAVHFRAAWI